MPDLNSQNPLLTKGEPYRIVWVLVVYLGSVMTLPAVWAFADITNGLMAIPNLISLILLGGVIVAETKSYLWNNRLDEDSNGNR